MKFIPSFLKRSIAERIRKLAAPERVDLYSMSHPGENSYCLKDGHRGEREGFPIPPTELMAGYGPDATSYLDGGHRHVADMLKILGNSGFSIVEARRVLELGCAAGRMIRHLPEATSAELWGVDVVAPFVEWCGQNLSPPIHFAVTTLVPHLPFEDRFFDFIYCGSVFTHIEDLQQSWLLELGRILRPGGRLYVTIHDESTVNLLTTKYPDEYLSGELRNNLAYKGITEGFDMFVVGRGADSQVFYRSSYFQSIIPRSP